MNTPLSIIHRRRQNQQGSDVNSAIGLSDLIFTEYSTQPPSNTRYFQIHTEHPPRQTICWARKQVPINLKGLKSFRVCSLTTMELNYTSIIDI